MRRIAVGGMAQIWLAVQRGPHGFEKIAVLKVILPELCSNDDFVQMFLDEARLAAGLDHSNVVRIYDFGEINGQYYLAMEHLPGEDLASIIQAARRAQKPLPLEAVCDAITGAATGLHFAHELTDAQGRLLNVVHRDVSPSNIIVTYHGTVKLVDFGIARAENNITKTAAGTLKGKVAYLSPEQAMGDPVDRRSDIFALGTVLYELITLTRPFKRESDLATLQAVLTAPIPPLSQLRPDAPPELERIVLKAMARDREERYQTAAELADDLSAFLVSCGYVRSERALATFMTGMFDEQRRAGKMRVAQTEDGADTATPSALKRLPQHLSPIRSNPRLEVKAGDLPQAEGAAAESPEARTTIEPSQVAIIRKRQRVLLAAGLVALFAVALVATVLLWPAPKPVVPPSDPIAKKDPPPKPPPDAPPVKAEAPPDKVAEKPPDKVADKVPEKAPDKVAEKAPDKPRAVVRGKLTLDTSPWSEVFLKGRKLGDTPLVDFPLAPGIYVLTLVNDGKNIRGQIEVEIQPGKTTVKKLKL